MPDETVNNTPPRKPSWQGKMCPVLSLATMRAEAPAAPQTMLVGATIERQAQRPESHATGCQGHACMWFVPMQERDEKGNVTDVGDGGCAAALIPVSVNLLGQQMANFAANYRVKPKS